MAGLSFWNTKKGPVNAAAKGHSDCRCRIDRGTSSALLPEDRPGALVDLRDQSRACGRGSPRNTSRTSYADLEAALAEHYDAAVIATPAHLHVPMAIRLAEAGVHLLLEKPLSTSMEGIDTLRQVVRDRRLVAAVAYVYRANPVLRAMREAIASGRFGRPVQVVAVSRAAFSHLSAGLPGNLLPRPGHRRRGDSGRPDAHVQRRGVVGRADGSARGRRRPPGARRRRGGRHRPRADPARSGDGLLQPQPTPSAQRSDDSPWFASSGTARFENHHDSLAMDDAARRAVAR